MKKITLFAMTEKGYRVLRALTSRYPGIVDAVVSSRDAAIQKDFFEEIQSFCKESSIPFYNRTEPYRINTPCAFTIAWRWLIKCDDNLRIIVFHDSLLPKYRGFNPLVTTLINGDTLIGVSAIYATKEYDKGDIIGQSSTQISYPMKIQHAFEIIQNNFVELALQITKSLKKDEFPHAEPQDHKCATYSLWRDHEDYFINWSNSAIAIRRMIDAVGHPYQGAAAMLDGKLVRILNAEALEDICISNRTAGKVIFIQNQKPVVVCGNGLLKIVELRHSETGEDLLPLKRFRQRFKTP